MKRKRPPANPATVGAVRKVVTVYREAFSGKDWAEVRLDLLHRLRSNDVADVRFDEMSTTFLDVDSGETITAVREILDNKHDVFSR